MTQAVEKVNLIVSPQEMGGGTADAELAIVCHTGTVTFGSEWAGATDLREQDDMLHGCGACDVKGFLSCMLASVHRLDVTQLRRRLCLVFTSNEEVGCRGARFLLGQQALRARYAIVGEPTSLVPARAGKGYCLASFREGKSFAQRLSRGWTLGDLFRGTAASWDRGVGARVKRQSQRGFFAALDDVEGG
jgi:acetylornithine deacetylase